MYERASLLSLSLNHLALVIAASGAATLVAVALAVLVTRPAGAAFRPLAAEQLAYLLVEEGKADAAIAAFSALMQDQDAPQGLRARSGQMITALGGTLPEQAPAANEG